MAIDYSKWDDLDEYFSDEAEDAASSLNDVRVTKLDGPSQVTFGGGVEDASPTILPSSAKNSIATTSVLDQFPSTADGNHAKSTSDIKLADPYHNWQEKGGMESITSSSLHERRLFWSQGRYSVLLRLELFQEEKIKTVKVNGAVPYSDRFCAVSSSRPTIQVLSTTAGEGLLKGELPHAVHFAEDENEIDWTVERSGRDERFLAITLFKAVPVQHVSVWWRRPFMQFDEIDVGTNNKSENNASQSFQQAWEEAHKIFQQRRQASSLF